MKCAIKALVPLLLLLTLLASCKEDPAQVTTEPTGEHIHQYISEVFPPTCTAEGYTVHVCSGCDDYYTDTPVAKLSHTFTDEVITPTCSAEGYTKHTCSVCGHVQTDTPTEKREHIYGDEIVDPTCTAEGYTKHTCYFCSDTYNDTPTSPQGHYYLPQIVYPTGTEQGYTLHVCNRCGDSYKDTFTDPVKRTVIVNFDASGGIMPEEPRITYLYQTGEHTTLPIPTKEGHVFLGWYFESDETEQPVTDGIWSIAEDIWLYAHWSPITVTYQAVLGEGGESFGYSNYSLTWGHTITGLPKATPKFGYLFDGFYDGDTRVTAETVSYYTQNITLTARFLAPLQMGHITDEDGLDYDWALYADGVLRFRITEDAGSGKRKLTMSIPKDAFRGMAGMVTVEFPEESLTDVGNYAFADCPDLKSITVPGTVSVIRSSVFEGCAALESVILEEGVSILNENAFRNCTALRTLTIPKSLLQIYSPFEGCTALQQIRYAGSAFQWSVIVKDPAATATFSDPNLEYRYDTAG